MGIEHVARIGTEPERKNCRVRHQPELVWCVGGALVSEFAHGAIGQRVGFLAALNDEWSLHAVSVAKSAANHLPAATQ